MCVCVCVCVCIYIYIYTYTHTPTFYRRLDWDLNNVLKFIAVLLFPKDTKY